MQICKEKYFCGGRGYQITWKWENWYLSIKLSNLFGFVRSNIFSMTKTLFSSCLKKKHLYLYAKELRKVWNIFVSQIFLDISLLNYPSFVGLWGQIFFSLTKTLFSSCLKKNKPKGLKVAKEDQSLIGSMVNGLNGR